MALTQTPEEGLKVSNAPSDGKFLQYKDSSDKLTWADVSQPGGATGIDFNDVTKIQLGTGDDAYIYYRETTGGEVGDPNNTLVIRAPDKDIQLRGDDIVLVDDASGGRAVYLDGGNSRLELGWAGAHDAHFKGDGVEFLHDVQINAQKDLRFADSDSSNYVALQAPATVSSNYTLTLPAADGSANQYLKTDGSGALSWSTVTTTALTGSTNNTICTVTGANAIQGEGNLTYDGSILDCTGKLRVDISTTGTAGSGSAEGIFLRNTNETDNNAVTIFAGADDYANAASAINFVNVDHSANAGNIAFDTRNGSNSYATRLTITSDGHTDIPDNGKLRLGTGNDFSLSHNGTNSFITNSTGELQFQANDVRFYTSGAAETHAKFINNGAVELYADNVKKLQTNSTFGTILSNTTDDANETNVLTLARRGYEASGYGVNFKVKGGSSSGQNGLVMQVSQGSGGYSDKFRFDNDGLKFGSDTAAANGLSDYETGTWTPAANHGPTAYGSGNYTKVGKMVFASFEISFGSSSSTSHQSITGLPFNCASSQHGGVADGYTNNSNNPIIYHISTGENKIYMYYGSGSNLNANNVTGDNFRGVAVYEA